MQNALSLNSTATKHTYERHFSVSSLKKEYAVPVNLTWKQKLHALLIETATSTALKEGIHNRKALPYSFRHHHYYSY